MRIVFLGTRLLGYEGLRVLIEQRHDILAAFTADHEITEGKDSTDFAQLCAAHRIACHSTDDLDSWVEHFQEWSVDLFVSAFWKRIVSARVLATARLGGVNVHQSALPRYRGYAPQNWAILRGDRSGGVTLHWMVPRADAGDIIDQRKYDIGSDDTIGQLGDRARGLALQMLRERIPEIAAGTAPRIVQRESDAVLALPRLPRDGWIEWERPSRAIHDLIRAVSHPYPGALTVRARRRLLVWHARAGDPPLDFVAMPGTVVRRTRRGGAWVSTGDGAIELLRVQPQGGPEVDAAEILVAGERLGLDLVGELERLGAFS